jgi:hypothetical protein
MSVTAAHGVTLVAHASEDRRRCPITRAMLAMLCSVGEMTGRSGDGGGSGNSGTTAGYDTATVTAS